jgi:hypothetical protein
MTPRRSSVQTYARIGGVLFLVSIVAGGFGEGFAPSQLVAPGDAAATARHILTSDTVFRVGFASYLVEGLCDAALTAVFFVLLRPIDQVLTVAIVVFRIMATATFAFAELFYFAPSLILTNEPYLRSFSSDQLNTLTLLSLNLYLMFRSQYLPRWLGIVWVIGGACFVLRTFAFVLLPAIPGGVLQAPQIVAILLLAIWLLAKGVDAAKWEVAAPTTGLVSL